MTVNMTTVMEPASIDSGLRRNDGWGSRNDGECDHTAWIPACAGMTVEGAGMAVNMNTVMEPASIDSGLRRNDEKIAPPNEKSHRLTKNRTA